MLDMLGGQDQGDGLGMFFFQKAGNHLGLHQGNGFQGAGFGAGDKLFHKIGAAFLGTGGRNGIFSKFGTFDKKTGKLLLGLSVTVKDLLFDVLRNMVNGGYSSSHLANLIVGQLLEYLGSGFFTQTDEEDGCLVQSG